MFQKDKHKHKLLPTLKKKKQWQIDSRYFAEFFLLVLGKLQGPRACSQMLFLGGVLAKPGLFLLMPRLSKVQIFL